MKYKRIEKNGYTLHMIKTNNFKSIYVDLSFIIDSDKEKITKMNFLNSLLTYSSKKYKTNRDLEIRKEELYSSSIEGYNYKMGNYFVSCLNLSCLNDKYTEKGNFDLSLDLLSEVLYKPNIVNKSYDDSSFNAIKLAMKNDILSVEEDGVKYSLVRMLDQMGDEKYSLHEFGYLKELDEITKENICDFYNYFINNSHLDITIVGDIDFIEIENLITSKFKWKYKDIPKDIIINHDSFNKEKTLCIDYPSTQGKLSIGYKIDKLTEFESNYVLPLYNIILGGDSESRLFKEVREKRSLCYFIYSNYDRKSNIFYISSGITKNNLDEVITLIKKETLDMSSNISDKELERAKVNYLELLDRIDDSLVQISSLYYQKELFNTELINGRKNNINKVTKEDIYKLSNKIKIDTIYLLGGSND